MNKQPNPKKPILLAMLCVIGGLVVVRVAMEVQGWMDGRQHAERNRSLNEFGEAMQAQTVRAPGSDR